MVAKAVGQLARKPKVIIDKETERIMEVPEMFLPKKGDYRGLIVYQKAECIYDLTFHFE